MERTAEATAGNGQDQSNWNSREEKPAESEGQEGREGRLLFHMVSEEVEEGIREVQDIAFDQ
jgi:hypothetical protein